MKKTLAMRFGAVGVAVLFAACADSKHKTPDAGEVNTRASGIYVTDVGSPSVLVFALSASGDAAPVRKIAGANTGLSLPIGIAVDSLGQIYVANRTGSSVTVYARDVTGDAAPVRTLTADGMGSPEGLAIGPDDDLFVSTCPGCGVSKEGRIAVYHFPAQGDQSDYAIGGPTNTGLTFPGSIALDGDKNVIIGNSFLGTISTFASGASGDVLPIRSFLPGEFNLQSISYGSNCIFVAVPGAGIEIFPAASGPGAQPAATLGVTQSMPLRYPAGNFVDTTVTPPVVYLVDYSGAALYVIRTAGTAPNLSASAVTTISGLATGLSQPLGVVVVPSLDSRSPWAPTASRE